MLEVEQLQAGELAGQAFQGVPLVWFVHIYPACTQQSDLKADLLHLFAGHFLERLQRRQAVGHGIHARRGGCPEILSDSDSSSCCKINAVYPDVYHTKAHTMTTPAPYHPSEIELAKRLACAAISFQMDISYQTYWKTYIKPKEGDTASPWPVGTAWIELARFVQKHLLGQVLKRYLSETSAPTDPTLQVRLLELSSTLPDEDLQLAISFLEGRAEHYRQNPGGGS